MSPELREDIHEELGIALVACSLKGWRKTQEDTSSVRGFVMHWSGGGTLSCAPVRPRMGTSSVVVSYTESIHRNVYVRLRGDVQVGTEEEEAKTTLQ